MLLPNHELQSHPLSYGDFAGQLFTWNGDLYRGIRPAWAPFYRALAELPFMQELFSCKLIVRTQVTEHSTAEFPLVLKHERIPFVTFPFEWSPMMTKAAGLRMLELAAELLPYGLTLKDGHGFNMLFDGPTPVFVDFTSIAPAGPGRRWGVYHQFANHVLYPLALAEAGHGRIARALLRDLSSGGVLRREARTLALTKYSAFKSRIAVAQLLRTKQGISANPDREALRKLAPAGTKLADAAELGGQLAFVKVLRECVQSAKRPKRATYWANYYEDNPPLKPCPEWNPKQQTVYDVLLKTKPAITLDIGSNRGWYARLAQTMGSQVAACDLDESSVDNLFEDLTANAVDLTPLMLNIENPSAALGVCNGTFAPASERLRCDLALALALTHHLVFKASFTFDLCARSFGQFTNRWLLVEFVPKEDSHVSSWNHTGREWYTRENFEKALRQHYKQVTLMPSHPQPRVLFLCEK